MIAYKNRFHGLSAVKRVYANKDSQTTRSPLLGLKSALNPKRSDYRAAVVVSKKISKSAVKRNRIRRQVYEVIRQAKITGAYDLVVTIYSDKALDLPPSQLADQVQKLLSQAGVTK